MTLASLKDTVQKYELLAKKSLGQNFLLDMNITRKIVKESLRLQGKENLSSDNMIEVGPGPGGLTRAVLENEPKSLSVIEMDDRCLQIMEELQHETKIPMNIISGDAMKQNFIVLAEKPRSIISNLPYNISVPLLTGWLKTAQEYNSLTLMFQKEVADRILAEVGKKEYGRISVLAQLTCKISRLFDLNPNNFVPAPKIWSTVLLFQPYENQPDIKVLQMVENLTAAAFGQRRKMIRQSLKGLSGAKEALVELNISEELRAEDVSPEEYLQIAKLLLAKGKDSQ